MVAFVAFVALFCFVLFCFILLNGWLGRLGVLDGLVDCLVGLVSLVWFGLVWFGLFGWFGLVGWRGYSCFGLLLYVSLLWLLWLLWFCCFFSFVLFY